MSEDLKRIEKRLLTLSVRCYDKNFCAGSTSFPIPTCTDDPSAGLTQNFQKRAEAAAVVAAAA